MLIALAAAWFYSRTAHAPTEPNTVVLAEFDNHTGDPAFDYALKQALKIDLQQSPFLKILSDQQIADTLRQMGRRPDEDALRRDKNEVCRAVGAVLRVEQGSGPDAVTRLLEHVPASGRRG